LFEADTVAVEEPPVRTDPRLLLALIEQTTLDLLQPGLLKQPFLMLLQRRPALTPVGPGLKAAGLRRRFAQRIAVEPRLQTVLPPGRAALNNLDCSNSRSFEYTIASSSAQERPSNFIRASL
jgi:hypothetical protein